MAADGGKALTLAYRYLNSRERTVAEVRDRLERAELPEDEIVAAIDELVEFGYLDDARYARVFTQDKRMLEGWGNGRIERVLRERGVEREAIRAALADGEGTTDELEGQLQRAIDLLDRRFPSGPSDGRDRERAFGMLARKGYDSEIAGDAVREWARRASPAGFP
jgi:regulatory protein